MEVNPANRREKIISLTETGKQYARELVLPLFPVSYTHLTLPTNSRV